MQLIGDIPVGGDPVDPAALAQIRNCRRTADQAALMADHHKGYAVLSITRLPGALRSGSNLIICNRGTGGSELVSVAAVRTMHAKNAVSYDKAIRELSASFRPFEDTMRDEVEWFQAHGFTA